MICDPIPFEILGNSSSIISFSLAIFHSAEHLNVPSQKGMTMQHLKHNHLITKYPQSLSCEIPLKCTYF